jgi:hypothetical protein
MSKATFKPATHFSIVWGVMLVFITLVEWRGLDRDPLGQQILSPFISRHVSVNVDEAVAAKELDFSDEALFNKEQQFSEETAGGVQYAVDIRFNGPLFLAWFFSPVLVFHAAGWLLARLRGD